MAASDLRIDLYANLLGYARYLASSNPNLSDTVARYASTFGTTFTYGTGSGQVNQVYFERITASSTQSYYFGTLSPLLDLVGDAMDLSVLKCLMLVNEGTSGSMIASGNIISGTSSSIVTVSGNLNLPPKCTFLWMNPLTGMGISTSIRDTFSVNPGGVSRTWAVFVAGVAA